MTPTLPDVEAVAIGWVLRHVEGEMGFEEIERFADWLQQSTSHGEAFDRAMASWAMLEAPRFEPEILALRSEALDALHAVQSRRRKPRWRWPGAGRVALAAAGLSLVIGAGLWVWLRPDLYETGIGERRVVALADGSQLAMDAQTSVTVDYRADGRHLVLEQGRATFTVAKDPLHPFSVASHGSLVVATGTQFGMEWLGDQTRVVLYEGHVAILRHQDDRLVPGLLEGRQRGIVADTLLTPGREAVVPESQAAISVHDLADPHGERAWEQGQIDVSDEPLGVVAARMNRYLPGPHLLVAQDAAQIRVSGLFNAGDLEAFVGGVTHVVPVVAERQADGSFCLRGTSNSTAPCR